MLSTLRILPRLGRFSHFADRIAPYLARFPRENILFLEFREFNAQPQKSVEAVMEFIGVDPHHGQYAFSPVPMWSGERRGRRMHPAVRQKLNQYFEIPNQKLFAIVGKAYPWGTALAEADTEEQGSEIVGSPKEQQVIIPLPNVMSNSKGSDKAIRYSSAVDLLPALGVSRKESETRNRRTISVSAVV
jgi:hypothetical protein